MPNDMYINPAKPPLGVEPNTLPTVQRLDVKPRTLVWGMVPMGIPSFGRASSKGIFKPDVKCPSCEYLVCFAFVNSTWHEVVQ